MRRALIIALDNTAVGLTPVVMKGGNNICIFIVYLLVRENRMHGLAERL